MIGQVNGLSIFTDQWKKAIVIIRCNTHTNFCRQFQNQFANNGATFNFHLVNQQSVQHLYDEVCLAGAVQVTWNLPPNLKR